MIFIGIDPGLDGAIVVLDKAGIFVKVYDIPTIPNGRKRSLFVGGLVRILRTIVEEEGAENVVAGIEKVGSMPGNSGHSMFTFGKLCGILEGILAGMGVSYRLVHPKTWGKSMLKDVEGSDTKARSILAASMLFPNLELTRKKDHNRSDAALIAAYVRRTYRGKEDGV